MFYFLGILINLFLMFSSLSQGLIGVAVFNSFVAGMCFTVSVQDLAKYVLDAEKKSD